MNLLFLLFRILIMEFHQNRFFKDSGTNANPDTASVVKAPDERWATDRYPVGASTEGRVHLAQVVAVQTQKWLHRYLTQSERSVAAEATLEQALNTSYMCQGLVSKPFLFRSNNRIACQ